jgi:hypothetical protein
VLSQGGEEVSVAVEEAPAEEILDAGDGDGEEIAQAG